MTLYHRPGCFNNSNVGFHSSGGWTSKIEVSVGLVSSEASLLGWQGPPSHCFLTCSSLGLRACVLISSKDISRIGLGPTHRTSFCLDYLFRGPVSKYSHILGFWDFIGTLRGHNSACNTPAFAQMQVPGNLCCL